VAQDVRLGPLAKSVLNLRLPVEHASELFAAEVQTNDLASTPAEPTFNPNAAYYNSSWPVEPLRTQKVESLRLWDNYLSKIAFFEHAKFYIINGKFIDNTRFEAEVGFDGLAYKKDENWESTHAKLTIDWYSAAGNSQDADAWRIAKWHLESFSTTASKRRLFAETTGLVMSNEDLLNAQRSVHDEYVVQLAVHGKINLPDPVWARYFHADAAGEHPGVSVADVDNDGDDDIYVTVPETPARLFINAGNGTFQERAAEFKIDIPFCTSSVFADFDNDGDADLVLGRYMKRSMYLRNDSGQFVDASAWALANDLPFLVTSISATDYNLDGLLDIYLCTYGIPPVGVTPQQMATDFLTPDDARRFVQLHQQARPSDKYLDQPGPPNVLLVNRGGGKFEVAPESKDVELWMNSFQATWSDYDEDGDPDLYVSNDYGPDFLMRNDRGQFTDVTRPIGGEAMMGLGMGATWGDYDNDGKHDLYVSNMYSKAGRRITTQIQGVDPKIMRSAEGNLLFRNRGTSFELVSGLEPTDMQVVKAGWSWGGQFGDVDNDGFLDIYVSSGYYSAPEEVSNGVDL
jgi:hypothetical protein